MHIVTVVLKTRFLDGIEMMNDDVPLGKRYRVDLDSMTSMRWHNKIHGSQRSIDCVTDVDSGGVLPIEILELESVS